MFQSCLATTHNSAAEIVMCPINPLFYVLFSFKSVNICIPTCMLSCVQLFVIPWTIAHQTSLSMKFSRKKYWSGLPFPLPEDLPNTGSNLCLLRLLHWQEVSLPLVPPAKPLLTYTEHKTYRFGHSKCIAQTCGAHSHCPAAITTIPLQKSFHISN